MHRTVIPAGDEGWPQEVLEPLVRLLVERGHVPLGPPEELGWRPSPSGWVCALDGPLTREDWAAVQERFVLPPTLVFEVGIIRDHARWADVVGHGPATGTWPEPQPRRAWWRRLLGWG